MQRVGLLLLLITCFLHSCAWLPKPKASSAPKTKPKALRHMKVVKMDTDSFHRVKVQGRLNASVHSGYKQPRVILRGDPRDLHQVVVETIEQTLLVSLGQGYPKYGEVRAEIRGRYLDYLGFKGDGILKGTKLKSHDLIVELENEGSVELGGYLMLRKLSVKGRGHTKISGVHSKYLTVDIDGPSQVVMNGKSDLNALTLKGGGTFSMHWVQGPWLKLCAYDNSRIKLAGVVGKLKVELHDNACFEGRYLRADTAFVKTYGTSTANISAVKHQHSLASDASNIYFYNLPEMRTDFMAFDGSVLDMRNLNLPDRKEYTMLNKWL